MDSEAKDSEKTIFYTWQSDRPRDMNRDFILSILNSIVADFAKERRIVVHVGIDYDADGELGAKDVAALVFDKISNCSVLVADITLINGWWFKRRRTPNPNVLVELGFAAGKIDWSKVILVANSAHGESHLMPFNIRNRKFFSYKLKWWHCIPLEWCRLRMEEVRNQLRSDLGEEIRKHLNAPGDGGQSRSMGPSSHPVVDVMYNFKYRSKVAKYMLQLSIVNTGLMAAHDIKILFGGPNLPRNRWKIIAADDELIPNEISPPRWFDLSEAAIVRERVIQPVMCFLYRDRNGVIHASGRRLIQYESVDAFDVSRIGPPLDANQIDMVLSAFGGKQEWYQIVCQDFGEK